MAQYNIWWIIVEMVGLWVNKPPPLEAEEQRKQIKKEREKEKDYPDVTFRKSKFQSCVMQNKWRMILTAEKGVLSG